MSILKASVTNSEYIAGILNKESNFQKRDREFAAHLSFVATGLITALALTFLGYGIHQLVTNPNPLGIGRLAFGLGVMGGGSLLFYDSIAFTSRFATIHNNPDLHPLVNGKTRYLIKEAAKYTVLIKIPTLAYDEKQSKSLFA